MNNLFPFFRILFFGRNKSILLIATILFSSNFSFAITNDTISNDCFSNDTAIINAKIVEFKTLVFLNPDSVLNCIVQIEKNTEDDHIIAHCIRYKGLIALLKGNNKEAIDYNLKALNLFKEQNDLYYVNVLNLNIGISYMSMTYYSLAMEYLYKARSYYDKSDDTFSKGRLYLNLTYLFIALKEYENANEYALNAKKYTEETNDTLGMSLSLYNIGSIHFINEDYDNAIQFFRKSLYLSKKSGIERSIAYTKQSIGEVFFRINKLDSAKFYFDEVLNNKETDNLTRIVCLRNYAEYFWREKNYKKAVNEYTDALVLSKKSEIKDQTSEIYKNLADIYSETNDFAKAYQFSDSSRMLIENIFEENRVKRASEFEEIYQSKKKQKQIENLSYENRIQRIEFQRTRNFIIGLISFLTLILLLGFFIFRFKRLKAKHKNAELEQKLLRSQMNPHFIFNAISSIQNYILKNEAIIASSYLSKFAKLMRLILLNSRTELISIENEVETLENYLKLQQLRFEDKFEYSINVTDEIEENEIAIPPMILQPFVENAIKHGINNKTESDSNISIDISLDNNKLVLEIEDNGIGRNEAEKLKKSEHKSLATEITQNRLDLLGKSFKKNAEIKILDLSDEDNKAIGTKVIIKLPIKTI